VIRIAASRSTADLLEGSIELLRMLTEQDMTVLGRVQKARWQILTPGQRQCRNIIQVSVEVVETRKSDN